MNEEHGRLERARARAEEPVESGLKIGVSACLLGHEVWHSGGHQRDRFVVGVIGRHAELIPFCPEVWGLDLGVPRPSLRLVRADGAPRMITTATGRDHTEDAEALGRARAAELERAGASGYIFKAKSPSCGLERVKVWNDKGQAERAGVGAFTRAFTAAAPRIACEESGRLNDPRLRFGFVTRVFAHHRLRRLFDGDWRPRDLVERHSREKMLLLAHSPEIASKLGRLVADAGRLDRETVAARYLDGFLRALAPGITTGRHVNALQHMAGHLAEHIGERARRDLAAAIDDYRRELLPLLVPLALIRHHARVHEVEYLLGQTYLEPENEELLVKYAV